MVEVLLQQSEVNLNHIGLNDQNCFLCSILNEHSGLFDVLLEKPGLEVNFRMPLTAISPLEVAINQLPENEQPDKDHFALKLIEHPEVDINMPKDPQGDDIHPLCLAMINQRKANSLADETN